MPIEQFSSYPPLNRGTPGFSYNLPAYAELEYPFGLPSGMGGLRLQLPESGRVPDLVAGIVRINDKFIGAQQEDLAAAPPDATSNLYLGLEGLYYAPVANDAFDALVGQVVTDADGIISVAQAIQYAPDRFGVLAKIDTERAGAGADTPLWTFMAVVPRPSLQGYPPNRDPNPPEPSTIGYGAHKIVDAYVRSLVAGTGSGNGVLSQEGSVLVTHTGANGNTADAVTQLAAASPVLRFAPTTALTYNSAAQSTGGQIEAFVEFVGIG